MSINKEKSGILIHGKRGKVAKQDQGYFRGYPYKKQYKYLGIIIDKSLNFQAHLDHITKKVEKGVKLLYITKKQKIEH